MKILIYHILLSAAFVFAAGSMEQYFGTAQETVQAKELDATHTAASLEGAPITAEACAKCHEDEVDSYQNTTHAHAWKANLSCAECHGDATKHLDSDGAKGTIISMKNLSSNEASATCVKCHEQTGEQSHTQLSEHFRAGVGCTECHNVHPTGEHKAEMNNVGKSAMLKGKQTELCLSCHDAASADFNKPTHHRMKEGVMECASCHNPHGSTQEHQLRADAKTLCVNCHQDKRGPFVYEHNAQSIDGCMACHESHGSASRNMLKDRDPRTLCISCHSKETGVGVPHSRAGFSLQTTGDCTRCHAAIHGSNHDEFLVR
jgi:DmsE family decaheme c-type cytochrome